MGKYVYAYSGGSVPETPEQQQEVMAAWMNWFGTLGGAIVDGGAPFGATATVAGDGSVSGDGGSLSGYSIIEASSLADAAEMAKGCPVLTGGGTVDVYEAMPM